MNRELLKTSEIGEISDVDSLKVVARSPIQNPLIGAAVYGLSGSACVAVGAMIRGNDVYHEGIAVLLGGAISGALAGIVGLVLLNYSPRNLVKVDAIIQCGAYFSAPAFGKLFEKSYSLQYTDVLIDSLVGGSMFFGGSCILIILFLLISLYFNNGRSAK